MEDKETEVIINSETADMGKENIRPEENSGSYTVDTEHLAMPEIHTGKVDRDNRSGDEDIDTDADAGAIEPEETEIRYDTLAVPEIHFRRKK